jgi:protein TonB
MVPPPPPPPPKAVELPPPPPPKVAAPDPIPLPPPPRKIQHHPPPKHREPPRKPVAIQPPAATPAPPVTAPPVQAPAPAKAQAAAAQPPSQATPNYVGQLLAQLQQYKQYPEAARIKGQKGTATLRFSIDRQGRLLSYELVGSSGHQLLDDEALALVQRAAPYPPLPDEIPGPNWSFTVPIDFGLH